MTDEQLFVALHRDYSKQNVPYAHAVLIGHTGLMRLWRGMGHTKEDAINDAEQNYYAEINA